MHYESIFKDYPPALPPPPLATKKRWGIAFAMRFLHVLCLATALSVLSLCAYQKLNSIFESGVLEYIKNEFLLSTDTKSLGDEVSSIAFGNTDITTTAKSIALPQIFYIPKEELIRRIEEEEASKELALSELYLCDTSNVPSGYYAIIPTDASTLEALEIKK